MTNNCQQTQNNTTQKQSRQSLPHKPQHFYSNMSTRGKMNEQNALRKRMLKANAEEGEKILQRLRLHAELFAKTHRFGAFTNWAKVHLEALFMSSNGASTYIGKEGFCSIIFHPCPVEERFAELPEEKGPIAQHFDLNLFLRQDQSTSSGKNPFDWEFK